MSVELSISTERIESAMRAFPQKFMRQSETVMRAFGQEYVRRLTLERLSGRPGVNRRTGNLARSFRSRSFSSAALGGVVLDVSPEGPGKAYAGLQEHGEKNVRPVKAKYLWIPIAGNLTAAGVARITPTEAINRGGFFAKGIFFGRTLTKSTRASGHTLAGQGYKGASFAKGEAITPLFVLKKSVQIPGRLGSIPLWASMVPATLVPALDRTAGALLEAP